LDFFPSQTDIHLSFYFLLHQYFTTIKLFSLNQRSLSSKDSDSPISLFAIFLNHLPKNKTSNRSRDRSNTPANIPRRFVRIAPVVADVLRFAFHLKIRLDNYTKDLVDTKHSSPLPAIFEYLIDPPRHTHICSFKIYIHSISIARLSFDQFS